MLPKERMCWLVVICWYKKAVHSFIYKGNSSKWGEGKSFSEHVSNVTMTQTPSHGLQLLQKSKWLQQSLVLLSSTSVRGV